MVDKVMRTAASNTSALAIEHRNFMAHFPTGVSIVTAIGQNGQPYGATCSSLTSVCLSPPTVMVSLASHSETLQHAIVGGVFGVTLLDDSSREIARRFSSAGVDRFADQRWNSSPLGTPWLQQHITAAADCQIAQSLVVGDHTLVFGIVQNFRIYGGFPLLYGLREYRMWN